MTVGELREALESYYEEADVVVGASGSASIPANVDRASKKVPRITDMGNEKGEQTNERTEGN